MRTDLVALDVIQQTCCDHEQFCERFVIGMPEFVDWQGGFQKT